MSVVVIVVPGIGTIGVSSDAWTQEELRAIFPPPALGHPPKIHLLAYYDPDVEPYTFKAVERWIF